MKAEIFRTSDFVRDTTDLILRCGREALEKRGTFSLSLCGGGTPKPVYAALARSGLDWGRTWITFGDERCVPPDHPESNYRMACETLLLPGAVPDARVLRMRGELDPEEAAREYETLLEARGPGPFVHDLILLGMGGDGHTASLFPGTAALAETVRQVVANPVPQLCTTRITVTYPLLNAARHVCFLVNDPAKAPVADAVLAGGSGLPAERVRPAGRLTWILGL